MSELLDRARAALEGQGEPGMYDDYDQACKWGDLVRGLIAELVQERESHLETVAIMRRTRERAERLVTE